LSGLGDAFVGAPGDGAFHVKLATCWGLSHEGADIVRRALVLVADHELNPSTFAARVAASTGASLAAAALAGFAALTGPLHGQASARALQFLQAALSEGPEAALRAILARGLTVPATGHALYPAGDPRAAALLARLDPQSPISNAVRLAEAATGARANIDMALAAITLELRLPPDAPFLMFASGRMVGWLAHAIEQSASGRPIRPRAAYVGA
jgi:citrate synthase